MSGPALISIASRQAWPQVLGFLHLGPSAMIILHSAEEAESAGPARRLRNWLIESRRLPADAVRAVMIPHDDFAAIEKVLDSLGVDPATGVVNLTGGNKLMALAAFRWAARNRMRAFYQERGNVVVHFDMREDSVTTRTESLDPHLADGLDPVDMLRCQLHSADIVDPGEMLILSERGRNTAISQIMSALRSSTKAQHAEDFRRFLDGHIPRAGQEGQNLEYAAAVVLLKLGVPRVRRSVELVPAAAFRNRPQPVRGSPRLEGELDLVFNWGGRLWVIDCKDRASDAQKIDNLRTAMLKQAALSPPVERQLQQVRELLEERQIKVLREDLQQTYESAGLMGQAVCVRSTPLPPQARDYAASHELPVIYKDEMDAAFARLLGMQRQGPPAPLPAPGVQGDAALTKGGTP